MGKTDGQNRWAKADGSTQLSPSKKRELLA